MPEKTLNPSAHHMPGIPDSGEVELGSVGLWCVNHDPAPHLSCTEAEQGWGLQLPQHSLR